MEVKMLDEDKFKNVVLYVREKLSQSGLGIVDFHQVLWLADLLQYLEAGSTVTDDTFIKNPDTPLSSCLEKVLGQLEPDAVANTLELPDEEINNLDTAIKFARCNLMRIVMDELKQGTYWQGISEGDTISVEVFAAELSMIDIPYEEIDFNRQGSN